MRMRRWFCLALALALLLMALPAGALAARRAKPSIKLPAKVGFMPLGATVTLKAKLTRVRADVIKATNEQQVPWDHSSLTGDIYFKPGS